MSTHDSRHSPAPTIDDLQLLQDLLAQRLYVPERDRLLLRALLADAPRQIRRRGARRRLRAGGAALVFGSALALSIGSPLLSASAASPQLSTPIVVAERAADNFTPRPDTRALLPDDALLRALLNNAAAPQQAAATTEQAAPQVDSALAQADLAVGQMLVIPVQQPVASASAAPPAAADQQNARTYVVKSGDTLSGIAQFFYGNGDLWPTIYNANTDKIANPHWIYPNQQLVIPGVASANTLPTSPPRQTGRGIGQYTVQSGDTLSGIAAYAYGNGSSWWGIFQANTRIIANPDLIYPGQVLTIP